MGLNDLATNLIHPFILYAIVGTCMGYIVSQLLIQLPAFRSPGSHVALYSLPFFVPFIALALRLLASERYSIYRHQLRLGAFYNWLCVQADFLAKAVTPLFLIALVLAVLRLLLCKYASGRFIRKYKVTTAMEYPGLFEILKKVCLAAAIEIPRIIVIKDAQAKAFVMGHQSPVIILSDGIIYGLDDDELEAVIAHELGHIINRDSLMNVIVTFIKDLMIFSPFSHLIYKHFKVEREIASDDFAIKLTGKPMALAQGLIKVWRLSSHGLLGSVVLNSNFIGTDGVIETRVRRIIDAEPKKPHEKRLPVVTLLTVSLLLLGILYYLC